MTEVTRRALVAGAAVGAVVVGACGSAAQDVAPTELSIAEAGRRMAEGSLTSATLTRAYLDRIAALDPQINSYITVTAESAMAEAEAADAERSAGGLRGPLHGVPIALKDNIDTAGVRTTGASAVFADRTPTEDAEVVRRLRAAGAVVLGKLNMHELAYGGTSAITSAGPVHNPWSLAHNPGGSSGGSAAAVAARLCAGALGTDTAASIRLPAAFCGVAGFKATHGLASIRGVIPLSEQHDHVGPICRSVEDCALMMGALAGFDPLDPVSIEAPRQDFAAAIGAGVSGFRIGVPRAYFEEVDPEAAAAVEAALEILGGLTAEVREAAIDVPDTFPVVLADIYAVHAEIVTDPERRRLYDPVTLGRIMDGANIPTTAYIEGRRRMAIARNTVNDAVFRDVDVLVTPTSMVLPITIESVLAGGLPSDLPLLRNTLPYDVLGIPAISIPCGFSSAGLPIGLQIAGPRLGEAKVLALAHAYEQATEWHTRRPPVG